MLHLSDPILSETKRLRPIAMATVPGRSVPLNTNDFFRTRPGLQIHESVREDLNVGAKRERGSTTQERSYVALLTKMDIGRDGVRKGYPARHLSILEDVAFFIDAQSEGQRGFLTIERNNVFFIVGAMSEIWVMSVKWWPKEILWRISCDSPEYIGGHAPGIRIIVPGTARLK